MRAFAFLIPLATLAMVGSASQAANEAASAPRAEIPFVDHGGLWDWQPGEDDRTVYFQDRSRRWYKATLFSSAFDLPFATAIRVDARPSGTLDKWGAIIVGGQRYAFTSFERIEGKPPTKAKKTKDAKAD